MLQVKESFKTNPPRNAGPSAPGIVSHNGAFYEEKLIHVYRIRKEQKKVIRQECRARAASDEHACEALTELNLNYFGNCTCGVTKRDRLNVHFPFLKSCCNGERLSHNRGNT